MEDKQKKAEAFNSWFSSMGVDLGSEEDIQALAALLDMPEEEFNTLKDVVLREVDELLSLPENRIALAESFHADRKTPDEAAEVFALGIESIDKDMDELSQNKKDFLKQFFQLFINHTQDLTSLSNRVISIPFEKVRTVPTPTYAFEDDAGMDLYSPDDYTIKPGETVIIPTGIKAALPRGYAFLIQPRSGLTAKTKLRVANTPGLIDSQYRDEIGVIIENIEPPITEIESEYDAEKDQMIIKSFLYGKDYTISKGERFAQMRLVEVPTAALYEVENVNAFEGNRGGGFGHSGK